jgi:hypothetical protein
MERGRSASAPLTKFDLFFEIELSHDMDRLPDEPLPRSDDQKSRKRKIVDGKVVNSAFHQAEEQRLKDEK